jgi:hypothetical protein
VAEAILVVIRAAAVVKLVIVLNPPLAEDSLVILSKEVGREFRSA